jgi:hypothetical protein
MQPQNVGGYLAYWNANQGRMTDYQTGAPLADRLAAVQSTQAPRGDMIYGDSYGGVQSAEAGQQQALAQQALAQEQMRQQALARQDSMRFRDQQANLDRQLRISDMMERARESNQRNAYDKGQLDRQTNLDAARRSEFTGEWENKMKLEGMKSAEKTAEDLKYVKGQGAGFSSALSNAFNNLNDSEGEVNAFEQFKNQWLPEIANATANQTLLKTDAGYVARNGGYENLAIMANQIADKSASAREAAARIRDSKNEIGKLLTQARASGFDISPDMSAVVHPQAGKFAIQLPPPVSKAADKPKDQPVKRSGVSGVGGRYITPTGPGY